MSRAFLRILRNPTSAEEWRGQRRRVVERGDSIRVSCVGHAQEDKRVDAGLFEDDVVIFVCGEGRGLLMPVLDDFCVGMGLHETKELVVTPADDGHPQPTRDPALIVSYPVGSAKVKVGMTVRINHEGEYRLATVNRLQGDTATLDMNDPLAGLTLVYNVSVEAFDADIDRYKNLFPPPVHVPDKTFNLAELSVYNGKDSRRIFIGCQGLVYDVTSGRKFYGPGGSYGFLAGCDATVALAKFSMNPKFVNIPWVLDDFDEEEINALANYVRTFTKKYPIVGRVQR